MNLFGQSTEFVRWIMRVGGVFFRARPFTTLIVIAASTLNRVVSVLAFLLPLKVILLVSSDGVSRWFAPFVGPEGKDTLVLVLTISAIVSFFLSIVLDALTDRLAESTGATVLKSSNQIAVIGNQATEAQNAYSQFTSFISGAIFTVAGLAVIGLVNPFLLGVLSSLFVGQFVLTGLVLLGSDYVEKGVVARFITEDLRDYVNLLSSVTFLVTFLVLLYPFVWGQGGDVIGALVSIIVLRRMLGVIGDIVIGGVKMMQRRPVIDALVFREHPYRGAERDILRAIRAMFDKYGRQKRGEDLLQSAAIDCRQVDVRWQDSTLKGMTVLALEATLDDGSERHYQQQIYMPKEDYRLENESVLFGYVSRRRLGAPEVVLRFDDGPFLCQLCKAGSGVGPSPRQWPDIRDALLSHLMCTEPPDGLVSAYTTSRVLLPDRLTDELVARLEVGVDTAAERETFVAIGQSLEALRQRLRELPLYIHNPEINQQNVLLDDEGLPMIMTWGQWALEPVGAGLPAGMKAETIDEMGAAIRESRPDAPSAFARDHLELAMIAARLEQQLQKHLLKGSLECAQRLVGNPLLANWADEPAPDVCSPEPVR